MASLVRCLSVGGLANIRVAISSSVTVGLWLCHHAGSLPTSLGSLPGLLHLDVSSNSLSGPLPSQLSSLTQLTYFAAGSNAFNGTVPVAYSSWSSLVYLDLQNNPLSGLSEPELTLTCLPCVCCD